MSFHDAIRTCLRSYVTFSGRASPPEYWWFGLFLFGANIVLTLIVKSKGPPARIFPLATFLPAFAVAWRRMHDTGRSGLFVLCPLLVMIGMSVFFGMIAGFNVMTLGNLTGLFVGAAGIIVALAAIVLLISPFLVLWWLPPPITAWPQQIRSQPTWGDPMTEQTIAQFHASAFMQGQNAGYLEQLSACCVDITVAKSPAGLGEAALNAMG